MLRKLGIIVLKVAVAIVISDWIIQWYDHMVEKEYSRQVAPFYPISYYSMNGKKRGDNYGYLHLRYSGPLAFENMPEYSTPYFRINKDGFRGRDLTTSMKPDPKVLQP